MTLPGYYLAKTFQFFGFMRRTTYSSNATRELQILRTVEVLLGESAWHKAENIAALSVEYWQISKLQQYKNGLSDKLSEAETAFAEHSEGIHSKSVSTRENLDEIQLIKAETLRGLEAAKTIQQELFDSARSLQHAYEGARVKLSVLEARPDGAQDEINKTLSEIQRIRDEADKLRAQRAENLVQLENVDKKLATLDLEVSARKADLMKETSTAYSVVGHANQDVSRTRAELRILDQRLDEYYQVIGKYLVRKGSVDPQCEPLIAANPSLYYRSQALRQSIILNQKLMGDR